MPGKSRLSKARQIAAGFFFGPAEPQPAHSDTLPAAEGLRTSTAATGKQPRNSRAEQHGH